MKNTITYYGREYNISLNEEKNQGMVQWLEDGIFYTSIEVEIRDKQQEEGTNVHLYRAERNGLTKRVQNRLKKEILKMAR